MTPELIQESKRFTENVGKCWHECKKKRSRILSDGHRWHYCTCGVKWGYLDLLEDHIDYSNDSNPTYTIELIRSELERVRKLGDFYIWLSEEYCDAPPFRDYEILQTPLLFLQAANSFIEQEREDAAYQTGNGG